MSKGLGLSVDEVLYEYSYAQLSLLSATLPTYDFDTSDEKKKEEEWDDSLDANIPGNFTL